MPNLVTLITNLYLRIHQKSSEESIPSYLAILEELYDVQSSDAFQAIFGNFTTFKVLTFSDELRTFLMHKISNKFQFWPHLICREATCQGAPWPPIPGTPGAGPWSTSGHETGDKGPLQLTDRRPWGRRRYNRPSRTGTAGLEDAAWLVGLEV